MFMSHNSSPLNRIFSPKLTDHTNINKIDFRTHTFLTLLNNHKNLTDKLLWNSLYYTDITQKSSNMYSQSLSLCNISYNYEGSYCNAKQRVTNPLHLILSVGLLYLKPSLPPIPQSLSKTPKSL